MGQRGSKERWADSGYTLHLVLKELVEGLNERQWPCEAWVFGLKK